MEGTDNNKCLSSDLWMSQIDSQFSGNLGNSSLRDSTTMSSPTHLDLSRKQTPLYSSYDLPGVHYKQNAQVVTSSTMQQFAPPSTRSAWEFAAENFPQTPKDFTSQTLSQTVSNTTPRFSQPIHDFTLQNMSQSQSHHFPPASVSQPHRDFPPQQSVGDFMSRQTVPPPQPVRGRSTHSTNPQQSMTDRSVWSHLCSLDPSIAYDMSGHVSSQNANFPQDKPYAYTLPHSSGTGGVSGNVDRTALNMSSLPLEKSPLILGKVTSSGQLSTPYTNRNSLPAENIPVSSLAPSMYSNVLGTANMTKQNQSIDYEEQLGGYSPVSPPTHDSPSPFSALSSDRSTDLSLKNDGYIMSSNVSDFSSSNSSKSLPINQFMHSNPTISDSNMLQLAHDVPLDMTKAWSSSQSRANSSTTTTTPITSSIAAQLSQPVVQTAHPFNALKDDMITNQHSDTPATNQFSMNQLANTSNRNQVSMNNPSDTPSMNQFATNQSMDTPSVNQFSANQPAEAPSVNQLPNFSQKIAPKKSNFYGRDASYFSVPEMSFEPSHPFEGDTIKNTINPNSASVVSTSDVKSDPMSSLVESNISLSQKFCKSDAQISVQDKPQITSDPESTTTSFADSFIEATSAPSTNSADEILSNAKESQINDKDIPIIENKEASVENSQFIPVGKEAEENILSKACLETGGQKEQTDMFQKNQIISEHEPAPSLSVEPDSFLPKNARGGKAPRGGKRKGVGIQKRQGKKAGGINTKGRNTIEIMEIDQANNLSEVSAVEMKKEENLPFQEHPESKQAGELPEGQVMSGNKLDPSSGVDPTSYLNTSNVSVSVRGGRAPRGGRKRGGATARKRQGKKAGGKTVGLVVENNKTGVVASIDDLTMKTDDGSIDNLNMEAPFDTVVPTPLPKTRAKRGKKRKTSPDSNTADLEESTTRRSSSRRSKDNAMRLIELQAESIYSHVSKPVAAEEPQEVKQPTRTRRKAAKAAVKSATFSDSRDEGGDLIEETISSSDEISDDKDVDYAVDEDDVEAMVKDQLLDMSVDQKKTAPEKKGGGLKISIKLGLDSSAEIVSGIDKLPPRKKRKVVKKKSAVQKFKSRAIIQDDDIDEDEDNKEKLEKRVDSEEKMVGLEEKKIESEEHKLESESRLSQGKSNKKTLAGVDIKNEAEEKGDIVDRHISLMDKYFSSATQARHVQKPASVKKENKLKKHEISNKSKSTKSVKSSSSSSSTSKTVSSSNSVPSTNSSSDGSKASSADANSTSDSGVPKFVCGYCPKRYHNKQELLSHMEAHMAEMEEKPDKASGGSIASKEKESKKSAVAPKKPDSGSSNVKGVLPKVAKKAEASDELKYNCGECGKSFSSKPLLLDHVRTHAAEKPFECNLCHKFFKERDQLSVHRKVHAQEGLFRCSFCSKGFVNNADLTSHMESHPKRSKSGQVPTKGPVPEASKKSTNPVSDLSKKSFKTQMSRDKETVVSKPKSFASALEPLSEKNKENPTILLRRSDAISSSSKDESAKAVKSTKPVANVSKISKDEHSKKQTAVVKVQDVKKETKTIHDVKKEVKDSQESKEIKSVEQKTKVSNEKSVTSGVKKEEKDKSSSGDCTCQECPECVTRFLQSFE